MSQFTGGDVLDVITLFGWSRITNMRRRDIIKAAWFTFLGSGLLLAWQLAAYVTDNIPDHILPIVEVLSGTQEAVPVAYMWTFKLGVLSVAVFVFSLVMVIILPRFLSPDRE